MGTHYLHPAYHFNCDSQRGLRPATDRGFSPGPRPQDRRRVGVARQRYGVLADVGCVCEIHPRRKSAVNSFVRKRQAEIIGVLFHGASARDQAAHRRWSGEVTRRIWLLRHLVWSTIAPSHTDTYVTSSAGEKFDLAGIGALQTVHRDTTTPGAPWQTDQARRLPRQTARPSASRCLAPPSAGGTLCPPASAVPQVSAMATTARGARPHAPPRLPGRVLRSQAVHRTRSSSDRRTASPAACPGHL